MALKGDSALIKEVEHLYNSEEGQLWEFLMGRHIHIGGVYSTQDLATKARIKPYMNGIELCCNSGETMRYLVRNYGVRSMHGVDLSMAAIERGRARCKEEGFHRKQIKFVRGDITAGLTMFDSNSFDFVWGEDAWCYIPNKSDLIKTASRLLKPNGIIVFSDWIKGSKAMTKDEYNRYCKLMTFPNNFGVEEYVEAMRSNGFDLELAKYSDRFVPCTQLYIDMLQLQFKADALRILHGDENEYNKTLNDLKFMLKLAKQGKISQGLFIGRKKDKLSSKL